MFELIPYVNCRVMSYDPFRIFDDMEHRFFASADPAVVNFRTDVSDSGDAYKLEAELPGFKKEDISIEIENGLLTISAERKSESEENKPDYIRRERSYGSFKRRFDLSDIDADAIEASYADGVLTLNLPKKQPVKPEVRRLEIN